MRVCLVNTGFDTDLLSPQELLDRYWHVVHLGRALASLGNEVFVIQAFSQDEQLQVGPLSVEFLGIRPDPSRSWAEIRSTAELEKRLARLNPDVVHVFGLTVLPVCRGLGTWAAQQGVGLSASFHGGRPARRLVRRWRQRSALSTVDAFFFSTRETLDAWQRARLLPVGAVATVASEVSSPFRRIPRASARTKMKLDGSPVLAWSGHLSPAKDPFTALRAMRTIVGQRPAATLIMAHQTDEMLPEIRAYLDQEHDLQSRVRLVGKLAHDDMALLFSAADFFVHTSTREHGSNSLVEALSCGAIPAVSKLPSLRMLTQPIGSAIHFEVGDSRALAAGILAIDPAEYDSLSDSVESGFVRDLSYPVLASTYQDVFSRIARAKTAGPPP